MNKLQALAYKKAEEYINMEDTIAVAITGSIARNMIWEGSDIDIWVFRVGDEDFVDGVIEGVYWEVDIKSSKMLDIHVDSDTWLKPLPLNKSSETLLEALWGSKILYDPTGKLLKIKNEIDSRINDQGWLNRRIDLFLSYGLGCLDALFYADPLIAIVGARSVATDYGIVSYWMGQGQLLTSVCRIPEKLENNPILHKLYKDIFSLKGESGANDFLEGLKLLPEYIQQKVQRDIEIEIIPVFNKGCYDGAVRHMRQGMARWFNPTEIIPVLAIDDDFKEQKHRILNATKELLIECGNSRM